MPVTVVGVIARQMGTSGYRALIAAMDKQNPQLPAEFMTSMTYLTREYGMHVSAVILTETSIKMALDGIADNLASDSRVKDFLDKNAGVTSAAIAFIIWIGVEAAQAAVPALGGAEMRDVVMDFVGAAIPVLLPLIIDKIEQSRDLISSCHSAYKHQQRQ